MRASSCITILNNPVLNQQYKQSDMQNHFFNNKNNIQNPSKHLEFELSDKQTPINPPLQEEDYSNNVLNTGFIAQDSKFVLSDSQSVISDGFSISGVSVIRANPKASPHIIHGFDEEMSGFSGMDEWSQSSHISFTKRNFKRNKPETIEDECDQFQNQFTKKKMNERNKVVTLSQATKGMKQSGYMLRSKSKNIVQEQSSSNEDIREILVNMEKQEKGLNLPKNKINQKA